MRHLNAVSYTHLDVYKRQARNSNLCTTHAISYDALVKIVMDDIQKHIKNMETLGDQFIEEMRVLSESGGGKKIKQFKQELELAEKRIAEIDLSLIHILLLELLSKIPLLLFLMKQLHLATQKMSI